MIPRRFRKLFARICVALLCMQAVVAAYACPAFLAGLPAGIAAAATHETHTTMMAGDCDEHPNGNAGDTTLCHQHYAGDQSVGAGSLASAAAAPAIPVLVVTAVEPVAGAGGITVLPLLLSRTTAPPLAIRFQVLRI